MIRLVGAETHRWLARRGLWVALAGAFAIVAVICATLVLSTRPPSGAEVDAGRRSFAEAHAYWVQNHETEYAQCLESLPAGEPRPEEACRMEEPQEEWYIPQPLGWSDATSAATVGGASVAGLVALFMAASFWGAEIRSGSLATWLTFVPARPRVWAAKMVVSAVAGAAVAAVLVLVGLLVAWLAITLNQGPDAVGDWAGPLQAAGRGVAFGAMMALVGAGLAVVFRSTVAAIAVPLGYLFVQGMLGILYTIPGFEKLTDFLPENNVRAFLEGGTTYAVPVTRVTPQGLEHEWVEKTISLAHGAVYLLVFVAIAGLVSLAVFQRRDVTE